MARRRKQTYDPRQLTLFDFMADKIEQIREENIQTDLQEQGASKPEPSPVAAPAPDPIPESKPAPRRSSVSDFLSDEPPRPLGKNAQGMTVYAMPSGARMYSRNLNLMQFMDGDGFSPEELFAQNRY